MLPIARLGDDHVCPLHGPNKIVTGGKSLIDGKPVARLGDSTACGATIVVGSMNGRDDGKPIAYLGCATSHGGSIVSGSPKHKIMP